MARRQIEFQDCEATGETDLALCVEVEGEEVWIPKSLVADESEVQERGDEGELIIPEWFAIEKGLV